MKNKLYVLHSGFAYYGPFKTPREALEWADYYLIDWTMIMVQEPPQNKFKEKIKTGHIIGDPQEPPDVP